MSIIEFNMALSSVLYAVTIICQVACLIRGSRKHWYWYVKAAYTFLAILWFIAVVYIMINPASLLGIPLAPNRVIFQALTSLTAGVLAMGSVYSLLSRACKNE